MKKHLIATFEQDYSYLTVHARFETADGWYDLMRDMFAEVHEYVEANNIDKSLISFSQIKEKFGTLNAYNNFPNGLSEIVDKFEGESYVVCEHCGSRGRMTSDERWSLVLCKTCMKADGRK